MDLITAIAMNHAPLFSFLPPFSLLATVEAEHAPIVLTGVLLSLVVIYFASKLGGEVFKRLNFSPVLGELVAGVLVGVSALHLLMFPESGAQATDSVVMTILQALNSLSPESTTNIFQSQGEVIGSISLL